MTANDIVRRLRFILDLDDSEMIAVFAKADMAVTRAQISDWLKRDDDPAYEVCSEQALGIFLSGLITHRRGAKDGPKPPPDKHITNNMVLARLKIAFELRAEDVLHLLESVGFVMSRHELSALLRKPGHKHYRQCLDQVLRNFLSGLQLKYRGAI
ncbi:MAG: hypothetical protein ACI9OJ_003674 [Myxococcota bacterium]|jgi:uncharacterized protein YehS (DUF1456 family)